MSIAKQTAGYMLAMIFLRMQAFLLLPFVARFVDPDELGVFDTVIGYATVVGMFAVLGLDGALATLYRHPDHERDRRKMAATVITMVGLASLIAGAGLVAFTGYIERVVFHGRWELGIEMALAAAGVMVGSLQQVIANILRQEYQVSKFNISVIGGGIVSFVATIAVVIWMRCGMRGMLVVVLLTGLLKLGLMLWWVRPYLHFSFDRALAKRLLVLGLPLLPMSVCGWMMTGFDKTLLQMWRTPFEVIEYGMASRFAMLATVATAAFQSAWWPYAMGKAREPGAPQHFQQVCRVACVTGAVLAAGVAAVTPVLMWLLLPEQYHQSFQITGLLVLANVINTYYYFPLVALLMATKVKQGVLGYFAGMTVTVLLDLVLVKPFGAAGAAMASVLGFLALVMVIGRLGRRAHDFGFPLLRTEFFLAGSILALSVWTLLPATNMWQVVFNTVISFVVIAAAGVSTGLLRRGDWSYVRTMLDKILSRFRRRPAVN